MFVSGLAECLRSLVLLLGGFIVRPLRLLYYLLASPSRVNIYWEEMGNAWVLRDTYLLYLAFILFGGPECLENLGDVFLISYCLLPDRLLDLLCFT